MITLDQIRVDLAAALAEGESAAADLETLSVTRYHIRKQADQAVRRGKLLADLHTSLGGDPDSVDDDPEYAKLLVRLNRLSNFVCEH